MQVMTKPSFYHSFKSLGIDLPQREEPIFRINQECKEPTILNMLDMAMKYFIDGEYHPAVLELFCADGYYACHAKKKGAHYVEGVDIDEVAIQNAKLARDLIFSDDSQPCFVRADVMDYAGSPFDIVLCCGGLYHLTDPNALIEKCKDLCNGFLVVQSVVSLGNTDPNYFETPAPGWKHGSRFSYGYLRNCLTGAGWNIVSEYQNELEANERLIDRGSAYFLCKKESMCQR